MAFSPIDHEEIRAIVREEIALDEMRRLEQASTSPCSVCGCMRERAGAGDLPTSPALIDPTHMLRGTDISIDALQVMIRESRAHVEPSEGGQTAFVRIDPANCIRPHRFPWLDETLRKRDAE